MAAAAALEGVVPDTLVEKLKDTSITTNGDIQGTTNQVNGDDGKFIAVHPMQPKQKALLLHKAGQYYDLTTDREVPQPQGDAECVVQVVTIGLNPVDWKGADFGFGQPEYPWINGRDFAGIVVQPPKKSSRIQHGNVVYGSSTDYRDIRKAAFQEYLIANEFNVSRLADGAAHVNEVASVGTGFIAAVVGLGVCFGIDFGNLQNTSIPKGPNLASIAREHIKDAPEDTHAEIQGISSEELPQPGEWLVVWGAGVAGQFMLQLAKFAGLKTACVEDLDTNGKALNKLGVDFMIDFKVHKPDRIVEVLRAVSRGKLRFGVDTVGKKTAESLQKAVQPSESGLKAHIVGLSGLADEAPKGVVQHKALPLKLFHELPSFGEGVSKWLEDLLIAKSLVLPEVETAEGGLAGINDALDRLRRNEVPGKRIVVPVRKE